jgi:hypothetical protein
VGTGIPACAVLIALENSTIAVPPFSHSKSDGYRCVEARTGRSPVPLQIE